MSNLINVAFYIRDIFLDEQSLCEEGQLFECEEEQVEVKKTVPTKSDLDIDMRYSKLKPTQSMRNNVVMD